MSLYRAKTVKGIKPYLCDNCGQWIAKGERHHHAVWHEPECDGLATARSHIECHAARVDWLDATDQHAEDTGWLVDEAVMEPSLLECLPQEVAARIRTTHEQKRARKYPPPAPVEISQQTAQMMLDACQMMDDAVKAGHSKTGDLVLHLLDAAEKARSALAALRTEAQPHA